MNIKNLGRIGKVVLAVVLLVCLSIVLYLLYITFAFTNYTRQFKLPEIDIDKLSIERSKYVGKEVTIGPIRRLVKLENYGGEELDKYFYLLHTNSDVITRYDLKVEKYIKIEKPVKFVIIGVDFRSSNVNSYYYCLLESSEYPGQVAQHECDKLDRINELTEYYGP